MEFNSTIIKWYNANKRILPWREVSDPYLIWISEIILQQTRVAQGYDYFVRFVQRFPDVATLAAADEDEVLRYWQGLGYYSRARNLHAAARSMNGIFPTTYEEVRALRGVGDYTAAAICSFAYNLPYAVVDGNVYRVLSRYYGLDIPIDSAKGKKMFAQLAQDLLDVTQPGVYNQAIMDFGALQCTPKNPACMFCPLESSCQALLSGCVESFPVKQHKTKTSNRYFNYFYVKSGDCVFLHQRNEQDIWKKLYEFPLIESETTLSEGELLKNKSFQTWFIGEEKPQLRLVCKDMKHVLSHQIIYATFYEITLSDETSLFSNYLRVKMCNLERYAIPRLIHSFLEKYV